MISEIPGEKITIRGNRNIKLQYSRHSNSDTTLFFVHGSMASFVQFIDIITAFQSDYNIVAYDYYGCGGSDKPVGWEEYSPDEHLTDLVCIVEKYKTAKNYFISHSFGTSQSIRLYSRLRSMQALCIDGIVLMGTTLDIPGGKAGLFMLPVFVLNWMQPYLSAKFIDMAFHENTPASVKDLAKMQSNMNEMHVCQAFYRQFKWCSMKEVEDIQCPVLVLQGEGDRITPVEGARELYQVLQACNQCECSMEVLPNCGHQMMQEDAAAVISRISSFLETTACSVHSQTSSP
mmetsp:Transcript_12317/g.18671  ORF Transcript_12317/g.18671 Transcript_12317/m.18671 type:complete len:289 (-) Transcript_12317:200-1066(-)